MNDATSSCHIIPLSRPELQDSIRDFFTFIATMWCLVCIGIGRVIVLVMSFSEDYLHVPYNLLSIASQLYDPKNRYLTTIHSKMLSRH